jgi:hypothetical protein
MSAAAPKGHLKPAPVRKVSGSQTIPTTLSKPAPVLCQDSLKSSDVTRLVPGAPLLTGSAKGKEDRSKDIPPRHSKWLSSVMWLRARHAQPHAEALSRALQTLSSLPPLRRAAWSTTPLLPAFCFLLQSAARSPLAPLLAVHVGKALERHRTLCEAALRDADALQVGVRLAYTSLHY